MEIVRATYQKSKEVPNQFSYTLPERLGDGIIRIDSFASGLNLAYMDLSPTKPITVNYETSGWSSGISFNLTGHSDVRSLAVQRSYSYSPGKK